MESFTQKNDCIINISVTVTSTIMICSALSCVKPWITFTFACHLNFLVFLSNFKVNQRSFFLCSPLFLYVSLSHTRTHTKTVKNKRQPYDVSSGSTPSKSSFFGGRRPTKRDKLCQTDFIYIFFFLSHWTLHLHDTVLC